MSDRTIPDDARSEIMRRLAAIEAETPLKVVFACESGSRAWGFASRDSDYDVRFLYVREPDWYLSVDLEDKRDVVETPIEGVWDINGWDLRKACRLFRKSNPPLLEWLQSPIVYREHGTAPQQLRDLIPQHYSAPASMYHYLHMAQKNYRSYLQGPEVRRKKYFYVLRPILACKWIEDDRGAVPMEFEQLVDAADLPTEVLDSIQALLAEKRAGAEADLGPMIPELNRLIESEFARFESVGVTRQPVLTTVDQLSQVFRSALRQAWS